MNTRPRWFLLGLGAVGVILLFTFPVWWPRLVNVSIDDPYPGVPIPEREILALLPPDQSMTLAVMLTPTPVPAAARGLPPGAPAPVAQGGFVAINALRWGQGTVQIFDYGNDRYVVRLSDFTVRNAPEMHVFLSGHPAPGTRAEMMGAGAVDLGPLLGNVGDQTIDIPPNINPNQYGSVVIFSIPFQMVMTSATLVR